MRILIIANYVENKGGISGVVYGHHVKIREEGHFSEIFSTKSNIVSRSSMIFRLAMKIPGFDVVHIHGSSYFGFFPVVLGVIAGKCIHRKKVIVTYHGGGAEAFLQRFGRPVRRVLARADHVTVMSPFLEGIFRRHGIQVTILPNLLLQEKEEIRPLRFGHPRLISIRAIEPNYNVDDIIKAFCLIRRKHTSAELRIAGEGTQTPAMIRLCDELHLRNVRFIGKILNQHMQRELKKSNIMISVPSIDNQPLSILEAFASGIPVVATNVGGVRDMITDRRNGFLVDPHRPDQIARKVDWIMTHKARMNEVTRNAGHELRKHYWESIRPQLFSLYS
jgi:glycosyltransferase involved in cell wall biosynthesis